MNKTRKILTIIVLTLSIISLVFGLMKKVGLCASSDSITWPYNGSLAYGKAIELDPYPYGYGSGSAYGKPSGYDLTSVVNTLLNQNNGISLITVGYFQDSGNDVIAFHGWYNGSYNQSLSSKNISPNMEQCNINGGRFDCLYTLSTGSCQISYTSNYCQALRLGDYALPVLTGEGLSTSNYYIPSGVWIPGYPIYYTGNATIPLGAGSSLVFDNDTVPPSAPADSTGSVTGSGESQNYDENGDPIGSSTYDYELQVDLSGITSNQENMQESLDDMQDTLDSILSNNGSILGYLQTILGKLTDSSSSLSWLEKIYGALEDIKDEISDFFGMPDFDDFQEAFEESDLYSILGYFSQLKSSVSDMFNVTAKTSSEMSDIYYLFEWDTTDQNNSQATFFDISQGIHFSFSWYESIRDKFLVVLFAFIYAGMIVYCMKQVPSLINGVSSGVQAGQSISHNDRKGE